MKLYDVFYSKTHTTTGIENGEAEKGEKPMHAKCEWQCVCV